MRYRTTIPTLSTAIRDSLRPQRLFILKSLFVKTMLINALALVVINAHASSDQSWQSHTPLSADALHEQACREHAALPSPFEEPWHIAHLYNCVTRELFVPYQLWTGAHWHGDKQAECMHTVDYRRVLPRSPGYEGGVVTITGPIEWDNPYIEGVQQVWRRRLDTYNSDKYYACHKRGIGIVHNLKKPTMKYIQGLCRAPAGFGWKLGQRRTCIKTTLEIVNVTLDEQQRVSSLSADYWFRDKLKYRYTYAPNQGTVSFKKY